MVRKYTLREGIEMKAIITWVKDNNYVEGIVGRYKFDAKVFDECSKYGIDGGRISKLTLRDENSEHCILNYDRGWDIEPDDEYLEHYEAIIELLEGSKIK